MIGTRAARFQHGSLMRVKNKTTVDTWYLRWYEEVDGQRVYRKRRIGTVRELPHRRDAEKAVLSLRAKINSEVRSPDTVAELIAHYITHELTEGSGKRSSTREVYAGFLRLHVGPKWVGSPWTTCKRLPWNSGCAHSHTPRPPSPKYETLCQLSLLMRDATA